MAKVILSTLALKELEESFDWYQERVPGLGERFLQVIDKALDIVSINPKAYPKKKGHFREMVIDKFPFIIVYEFVKKDDVIYVLHVFHTKRNPKYKHKKHNS